MLKKNKGFWPKTAKYFLDFLVVFSGVFLAFWLSEIKERQKIIDQEVRIYIAIYEDLNQFYAAGNVENQEGFINLFKGVHNSLDSLVDEKKLPVYQRVYGDYLNLEIVNSLVESGQLKDLKPEVFKAFTRFNTLHQMFLGSVERFNQQYNDYITLNYEEGTDYFYVSNTNELKSKYKVPIYNTLPDIIDHAEMMVESAQNLRNGIKEQLEYEFEMEIEEIIKESYSK